MHSFVQEGRLLLLGALLGTSVGCAEGPIADDEGWASAYPVYPVAEAGLQQPDAAFSEPVTSQPDSDFNATVGNFATSMSTPTASFDAAANSLLDANTDGGYAGSAASSFGASTSDAPAMSSDASSTTGSVAANAPDAGSTRADSGVPPTSDSGATCDPLRCDNRCALLMRCCDTSNQCACLDPGTRMCTLQSL